MAVDYVVHFPCPPKTQLGDSDSLVGSGRIVEMLKARNRAVMIRDMSEKDGQDPNAVTIKVMRVNTRGQSVESVVRYADLKREGAKLKPFEAECDGCPANCRGRSFGCFGFVSYPIPRRTEEWLMDLVQPPHTVGGHLFQRAVNDFHYHGQPIQRMRKGGLFEARAPVEIAFENEQNTVTLTSDQVWQAILGVGGSLDPWHSIGVLLWLGAVEVDGRRVETPEDALKLRQLATPAERNGRTAAAFGDHIEDAAIVAARELLRAMYLSWVLDVPLLISA